MRINVRHIYTQVYKKRDSSAVMRFIFSFIIILFFSFPCVGQVKLRIQGMVNDISNNTSLPGATILVKEMPNIGATSDMDGVYSLSLPAGSYTLICSFMGYESVSESIYLDKDTEVNFNIREGGMQLNEVVVSSKSAKDRLENVVIGAEKIEISEMARVPTLFGERDIIKSIQLLPGIKSEGDGTSGYQVRGGTSAQNLILLDDAPVYNAGHMMGIFSTFNDEALTNATLYKGQIPSQLGGATSSVFDIKTKSGNYKDYNFSGSIGLLSAKVNIEGPIIKDKMSFFLAARRSYFDLFLKATDKYKDNTLNFHDINFKVNYNISEKDRLFISFFCGKDNMGLDDLLDMEWGNNVVTARWFHQFNSKLYSNTSLIHTLYSTSNAVDILDNDYSLDGFIHQAGIKEDIVWMPNENHSVNVGFQSMLLNVKSAEWEITTLYETEERDALDNTLWLNDEWKASSSLTISAGLRLNIFSALGGAPYYKLDTNGDILQVLDYKSREFVKTYFTLEPRVSLNYRITDKQSLKAGYSRTSQNIHALRNSSSSMPFDRYTMNSNNLKPQIADQVSLGYVALTDENRYEFSIESYYKKTQNVLDYRDGKSFSSEIEIERLLLSGEGRAYGVEFYAKKNLERLTGWLSYTLSWSENKIEGINNNKWYTAGNDRRHDISLVGMYELPNNWHLAATWVYNTGQALTAPSAKYELNEETNYYYAERNGYRAPDYHRLDVSISKRKKTDKFESEWSFGLYNLYNRYNPYIISFENDNQKPSGTKTMQYSLFGILPSVSYGFKF